MTRRRTILVRYRLDLAAAPDPLGREPVVRLRMALKRLLRDYGLRCERVAQVDEPKIPLDPAPGCGDNVHKDTNYHERVTP